MNEREKYWVRKAKENTVNEFIQFCADMNIQLCKTDDFDDLQDITGAEFSYIKHAFLKGCELIGGDHET